MEKEGRTFSERKHIFDERQGFDKRRTFIDQCITGFIRSRLTAAADQSSFIIQKPGIKI